MSRIRICGGRPLVPRPILPDTNSGYNGRLMLGGGGVFQAAEEGDPMDADHHAEAREITFEEFDELKKADRIALLAISPDEAQQAVEQILHPRLWRIEDTSQLVWPGDLADDLEGD
jgi:hypothetical protein